MANANDISDVQSQAAGGNTRTSVKTLPIRGEKRILPVPINPTAIGSAVNQTYTHGKAAKPNIVQYSDFYIHAALKPYVDYVYIRILNRGQSATGTPDPTTSATYRFLINPSQVQVSRSTLDAQAFARAGWQFGVWGEDMVQITLVGKTAGQYWAFGTTDLYQQYTQSYRNMEQLQVVFENNGYWFEGEQINEGPLAADFARRRIKMQQDVELTVGNFIWPGMFESLELSQNAEAPFLVDFTLSFIAWKERYRPSSPYPLQIKNDLQRGNSYNVYAFTQIPNQIGQSLPVAGTRTSQLSAVVGLAPPSTPNVNPSSPAVSVANQPVNYPSINSVDYVPTSAPAAGGVAGANTISILGTPVPVGG